MACAAETGMSCTWSRLSKQMPELQLLLDNTLELTGPASTSKARLLAQPKLSDTSFFPASSCASSQPVIVPTPYSSSTTELRWRKSQEWTLSLAGKPHNLKLGRSWYFFSCIGASTTMQVTLLRPRVYSFPALHAYHQGCGQHVFALSPLSSIRQCSKYGKHLDLINTHA